MILDIAHVSFLDMIKVMITLSGAASAKGTLVRNAIKTADRIAEVDYPTFEAFLAAVESASNPITMIEGKATHQGNHVFGLAACPFGPSVRSYTTVFEKLPDGFADFTAEFNRPSATTDQYRVGEGAGDTASSQREDRMASIRSILTDFTKLQGVSAVCLVGRDGFLLDSVAGRGIDAEMIGAIASSGYGSSESMGRQLGKGAMVMTMSEFERGPVLSSPVGEDSILVVIAEKDANLGMIRLKLKKEIQALATATAA